MELEANVEVSFSEAIDPNTINNTTFILTEADGTPVAATVGYDPATKKATLDPDVDLDPMGGYTVRIKGGSDGVKDLAGNPLATDEVWSFTTTAKCTISGTSTAQRHSLAPRATTSSAPEGHDTLKGLRATTSSRAREGTISSTVVRVTILGWRSQHRRCQLLGLDARQRFARNQHSNRRRI